MTTGETGSFNHDKNKTKLSPPLMRMALPKPPLPDPHPGDELVLEQDGQQRRFRSQADIWILNYRFNLFRQQMSVRKIGISLPRPLLFQHTKGTFVNHHYLQLNIPEKYAGNSIGCRHLQLCRHRSFPRSTRRDK